MTVAKYILIGKTPVLEPDFAKWTLWLSRGDMQVAKTIFVADDIVISTTFLGLDASTLSKHYQKGPPRLFLTAVINGEMIKSNEHSSTWEEACAKHQAACDRVRREKAKTAV